MIELQRYNGQSGRVIYDNFQIGDERQNFRLKSVGQFTNDPTFDIGNSLEGAGFGKQGYSQEGMTHHFVTPSKEIYRKFDSHTV